MGLKQRSARRRKRLVGHIARNHADAERWDLEFWQKQGSRARLAALEAILQDIRQVKRRRRR